MISRRWDFMVSLILRPGPSTYSSDCIWPRMVGTAIKEGHLSSASRLENPHPFPTPDAETHMVQVFCYSVGHQPTYE